MATELKPTDHLIRLVHVPGIDVPVNVTFWEGGIMFRIPNTRTIVQLSWTQAINAAHTPGNVPSFLMDKPFQCLSHMAKKRKTKLEGKDAKASGASD